MNTNSCVERTACFCWEANLFAEIQTVSAVSLHIGAVSKMSAMVASGCGSSLVMFVSTSEADTGSMAKKCALIRLFQVLVQISPRDPIHERCGIPGRLHQFWFRHIQVARQNPQLSLKAE